MNGRRFISVMVVLLTAAVLVSWQLGYISTAIAQRQNSTAISLTISPSPVVAGQAATVSARVRAGSAATVTVDVAARNAGGTVVWQQQWANQVFAQGQSRTDSATWSVPATIAPGTYTLSARVLSAQGAPLAQEQRTFTIVAGASTQVVQPTGKGNSGHDHAKTSTPVSQRSPATATPTKTPSVVVASEPAPVAQHDDKGNRGNKRTATPVPPTATPAPLATATPVPPTATATSVPPTAIATATATAAPIPLATATATPGTLPVAGQECPAWVHDRVTTTGPDGRTYLTWHPPVDPEFGCTFGHEHGDDPRTSRADSSLPAFGYIGQLAGDNEPHVGFKVFVQNAGTVNDEGRTILHDSRMVFHMGTAGPKRFTAQFHSLEFDFIARDGSGHEVHVMGMADTGGVGSICADPRQGRTVMVVPGLCATDSLYEIWAIRLHVGKAEVNVSTAVFDPITVMDPADPSRLLYTSALYPQFFGNDTLGCRREAYSGPVYYYNRSGPTSFRTDAYGNLAADGPLVQFVSQHDDLGVPMTSDGLSQAKLKSTSCSSGLHTPN